MRSRWAQLTLGAVLLAGCTGEPTTIADDTTDVPNRSLGLPEEWGGGAPGAYIVGLDAAARSGANAGFIAAASATTQGLGTLTQGIRADDYRGKRVRWSAWVRHTNVQSAGLWMRVDGYTRTLAYDDMDGRRMTGTSDWHQVSVVLDVDSSAAGIKFGVLLAGSGDVVVDDMAMEVVDGSVPVNATETSFVPFDSAQTVAAYGVLRRAPTNLAFEGAAPPDAAIVQWLAANSVALTAHAPTAPLDDLAPLGEMIADARIVGLGEGTHGTREFFQMKHRIFRYLVEEKQFRHFAIEASWPESNLLNHYVLTGVGDPAALVKGMHFWTWSTHEVLDLVNWMRAWNTTAPPERRVQFLGFDMQFPGLALDTVAAFVNRTSPSDLPFVQQRLACIAPYRNYGGSFPRNRAEYAARSQAHKDACRDSLSQVHALLEDNEAAMELSSSDEEHARALQSARLVQQFEEMTSGDLAAAIAVRDRAMAENVDWLLSRGGGGARIVLWAHNYHVGRTSLAMGKHLSTRHGSAYRNLGFLFGTGWLLAIDRATLRLQEHAASLVPKHSMEAYFGATGRARALFDTRTLAAAGAPSLLREIRMRLIGSVFSADLESAYYSLHRFPEDFDLLIYFASANASVPLP